MGHYIVWDLLIYPPPSDFHPLPHSFLPLLTSPPPSPKHEDNKWRTNVCAISNAAVEIKQFVGWKQNFAHEKWRASQVVKKTLWQRTFLLLRSIINIPLKRGTKVSHSEHDYVPTVSLIKLYTFPCHLFS